MASYNPGIFQQGETLQFGDKIAHDYFKMTDDPGFSFCDAGDRDYTVRILNEGFFHKLLMRYTKKEDQNLPEDLDRLAVFLGVYSMKFGITIGEEDMEVLRSTFERVKLRSPLEPGKLYRKGKKQMEEALKHYKSNGEAWDFEKGHHLSRTDSNPGFSISTDGVKEEGSGDQAKLANKGDDGNA